MKTKYIIVSSVFALSLGAGLTSCSKNDDIDKPIELPVISTTDQEIASKPIIKIADDLNAKNSKSITIKDGTLKDIKIVTFCDKTFAVIPEKKLNAKAQTRAESANEIVGEYTISGGNIVCTFTLNGDRYMVEIPTEDLLGIVSKVTVTKNSEAPEDVTYNATMATTEQAISICRTWYPTNYQAVVYSDEGKEGRKIFGNYSAKTLADLQRIVGEETKTNIDLLGGELQKFSFAGDGTIVSTINGNSNVYQWSWSNEGKAEFKATFGSNKQFQNLPGFVRYTPGTPNTAEFVLECEVDVKGRNDEKVKGYVKAIITAKDAK